MLATSLLLPPVRMSPHPSEAPQDLWQRLVWSWLGCTSLAALLAVTQGTLS